MKYIKTYEEYEEYGIELNTNDLQNYLNKYCKDFSWNDKPIYRGIYWQDNPNIILFNPKSINRKSANTENYYTLLFDNSPYRNNFPKRSKSLICSTNPTFANSYGILYRVIPFDNAKIAICNNDDFWYSFKEFTSLEDFNLKLSFLYNLLTGKKLIEKYDILIKQIKELMNLFNKLTKEKFENIIETKNRDYFKLWKWDDIKNFPKSLDEIYKTLDPIKNDMKLYDYNKYKNIKNNLYNNEVWTDSKAILVKDSFIKNNPF